MKKIVSCLLNLECDLNLYFKWKIELIRNIKKFKINKLYKWKTFVKNWETNSIPLKTQYFAIYKLN